MSFLQNQDEDLPSSDSDDEEYVPSGADESEEEGSGLNEEDSDGSDEEKGPNNKKRKKIHNSRKRKHSNKEEEIEEKVPKVEEKSEDRLKIEKEKSDNLWATFLKGVDTPPTKVKPQQVIVTKTYEFAGTKVDVKEKVDVPQKSSIFPLLNTKKSDPVSQSSPPVSSTKAPPVRSSFGSGGSSAASKLLGLMGKTQKLSTLDKSRLDWESYVEESGDKDELKIHNRGKMGFLERKAFEARTETRQFEIERDIRLKSRPK